MNDLVRVRTPRRWRTSQFWTTAAGALAGLCLTMIVVWEALDASFRPALLQWEVSLGLRKLLLAGPTLNGDWGLNDQGDCAMLGNLP